MILSRNATSVADSINDFREWLKRKRMIAELKQDDESEFIADEIGFPPSRTGAVTNTRVQQMIDLLAKEPLSAAEIAKKLGLLDQSAAFHVLNRHPKVFRVVGEKRLPKHPYVKMWGLVAS